MAFEKKFEYLLEEKKRKGWKTIWTVDKFSKVAFSELEKAQKGIGRYDKNKQYRLVRRRLGTPYMEVL